MWLKNTAGQKDAMLTFAMGGFLVTALSIVATLVESVAVGDVVVKVSSPDATIVTAFLGATLLAYVNRRNKKDEYEFKEKELKVKQGILE